MIQRHAPDRRLRPFVAAYQTRTAHITGPATRIPLPARTDVILEFYFTTPHMVELQRTGERSHAPWSVVVGTQTWRRVDLLLAGRLDVFTVRFRPTGLHRLFGAPMPLFTDAAVEAEHLFGKAACLELHEQLHAAPTLAARSEIMDRALLSRLRSDARDPITEAALRIHRTHGAASLSDLEAASGLSDRQFRRAFKTQVGTAPKLYGRIVRLHAALDAKACQPAASWTEIAHQFGWYDQAHLDKDFLMLTGASPTAFAKQKPAA